MPRDEWVVSLHPSEEMYPGECVLLLQDLRLLQSCSRGGGGEWRPRDMCRGYERQEMGG